MNLLNLPIGKKAPKVINAVVEVPFGCTNKYEYDAGLGVFRLDRPLYASVHYPGEYGFIPQTAGKDGDPLDVLALVSHPTFTGCVMEVRPLGVLRMMDQGVRDEKILAVATTSPTHAEIRHYENLATHVLREIEHFFSVYKELEGTHAEVHGWDGPTAAHKFIREGNAAFKRTLGIIGNASKE